MACLRQRIEAVEKLCEIARGERINDRAVSDLFLHKQIDDQKTDADECHGETEVERRMIRNTHAEAVPWAKADVCDDRQVNTVGKHNKPQKDLEPFSQYFDTGFAFG